MTDAFPTLLINNREVLLDDIVSAVAEPRSGFEQNCFEFVRQWFSDADEFSLQTSGSTGTPKVIVLRRRQMIASAQATAQALDLKPGDTALICLDPRYIAGQMMFVRSFTNRMRIIATDPVANPLHSVPLTEKIDFTAVVPLQLQQMLESPEHDRLNSIRCILVGGAAVPQKIIHQLDGYSCRVVATYGMTETISHIALKTLNGPAKSPWFRTLPGVGIDADERGCLRVAVPYLESPLTTNDLVRLISPNEFEWLGRVDNVINTGGVKVSPERIERVLELSKVLNSLHARFVILSRPHGVLGEEVVCMIEREFVDNDLKLRLKADFSILLSRFEIPRDILGVCPFPETKSGKIDRTALKNLANS